MNSLSSQTAPEFQILLTRIENADDFEINEIMDAVWRRYRLQFPDWEVLYFACPKNDPAARKLILDFLTANSPK